MTILAFPLGKIPNFTHGYGNENAQIRELLVIDYLNGTNIYKYQILVKHFEEMKILVGPKAIVLLSSLVSILYKPDMPIIKEIPKYSLEYLSGSQ